MHSLQRVTRVRGVREARAYGRARDFLGLAALRQGSIIGAENARYLIALGRDVRDQYSPKETLKNTSWDFEFGQQRTLTCEEQYLSCGILRFGNY
jgi:hypothetical protein